MIFYIDMDQIVNVNEFQELAKRALPKMYYDFYSGGAEDQHTLKENVEAFTRIINLFSLTLGLETSSCGDVECLFLQM
ncbi:hypothetical protein F2Q68_00032763 [Brassica cretica]|uniref:FMN-dependent dehydrogenase domain-containing protein n=1 Tax=Brassica cretica TaxID=69181 RepID=A0A8S9GHD7_BRACR|nr:hypothetical protein F2Q68_00032763 [Brassica cretica]